MAMEMNCHGYARLNPGMSVSGLKSWMRNPMLRGIVPHQQGGVKPLVSADEWGASQTPVVSEDAFTGFDRRPTDSSFSSLIVCASCGRSLHRCVTGYHRVRWKCCYAPCDWYGRSIAESLARTQAVEALRKGSHPMAQEARRANNAKARKSAVQVEAENKLAQLLQLQESGVPELETSISSLRRSDCCFGEPRRLGRTGKGLAELVAGGLDMPATKNSG